MAHFRGTLKGNRGEVSRLGSRGSGLFATLNGWHVGVAVTGAEQEEGGDVFFIHVTGGSNNRQRSRSVGRVVLYNGEPTFIPDTPSGPAWY